MCQVAFNRHQKVIQSSWWQIRTGNSTCHTEIRSDPRNIAWVMRMLVSCPGADICCRLFSQRKTFGQTSLPEAWLPFLKGLEQRKWGDGQEGKNDPKQCLKQRIEIGRALNLMQDSTSTVKSPPPTTATPYSSGAPARRLLRQSRLAARTCVQARECELTKDAN